MTLPFEAGREVARSLEVATEDDYLRLMKSKAIPEENVASRLPYRPDLMYKENWNGWDDFLVDDASQRESMWLDGPATKKRKMGDSMEIDII